MDMWNVALSVALKIHDMNKLTGCNKYIQSLNSIECVKWSWITICFVPALCVQLVLVSCVPYGKWPKFTRSDIFVADFNLAALSCTHSVSIEIVLVQ